MSAKVFNLVYTADERQIGRRVVQLIWFLNAVALVGLTAWAA